jgi:hypothetical protein
MATINALQFWSMDSVPTKVRKVMRVTVPITVTMGLSTRSSRHAEIAIQPPNPTIGGRPPPGLSPHARRGEGRASYAIPLPPGGVRYSPRWHHSHLPQAT